MEEKLKFVIKWLKANKEVFKKGFDTDRDTLLKNSLDLVNNNLSKILNQETNKDQEIKISEVVTKIATGIAEKEMILTADSYHSYLLEALGDVYIEEFIE